MTIEKKNPILIFQNRFERVEKAILIKNAIKKALEGSDSDPAKEKTIISIANETGYPKNIVHWYLTSMRKYSVVVETTNREGQYHKWALAPRALG